METWVLDYFDAFQVGLTATPDNRTFAYLTLKLIYDYGYYESGGRRCVMPYNVFEIETKKFLNKVQR